MMIELVANRGALDRIAPGAIAELARLGTDSNYRQAPLRAADEAFIERVVALSTDCVTNAAVNDHKHLVAAFVDARLAGFVIATVHDKNSRELDWLFVDPRHHGQGLADRLMLAGMEWLGTDRPMWLNVARQNERAIAFYEKHRFVVDPEARCAHAMPHWIMRRAAD